MDYILEMKGISKSFGEVQSLRNVDFRVGANGSSGCWAITAPANPLIKIITGYYRPDSGGSCFAASRSKT